MRSILLVVPFLAGCMCLSLIPPPKCSANAYADARYQYFPDTSYVFGSPQKTPAGISVDSSGQSVDLAYIDQQTTMLEGCLGIKIERCNVRVKVAPDWKVEPRGQYFACKTSPDGMCTGINQYPALIVTTPSLASYRHELIHLVTHKDHGDPVFEKCDGH